MSQIQANEEYKRAVEAYVEDFGERPPYCVEDPEYIMDCVRKGKPSDHIPMTATVSYAEGATIDGTAAVGSWW